MPPTQCFPRLLTPPQFPGCQVLNNTVSDANSVSPALCDRDHASYQVCHNYISIHNSQLTMRRIRVSSFAGVAAKFLIFSVLKMAFWVPPHSALSPFPSLSPYIFREPQQHHPSADLLFPLIEKLSMKYQGSRTSLSPLSIT